MITRVLARGVVALGAMLLTPLPALAQGTGIGIGPRITFVRGSADLPDGAQRFSGGAIRFGSGKTALEIAMDFRSGITGDLTERIKDYPIQGSLLVFPIRGKIAPYLLGGIGWYSQHVERLRGQGPTVQEGQTTRTLGYHGGLGGEVRVLDHLGLYGDYRFTQLRFGGEETTPASGTPGQGSVGPTLLPTWIPFAERLRLSHQGSMFTWGATFYF